MVDTAWVGEEVLIMALYGGITLPGQPDLNNVRRLDLLPMPCINDMMRYGMAIDREWLAGLSTQFAIEMSDLEKQICSYIPKSKLDEFVSRSDADSEDYSPMNVNSQSQLATLLFKILGVGSGSSLYMTKSGDRPSTGKKQLEKFKRSHPIVPLVLSYKEVSKLKSTYVDALPELAKYHPKDNCWCGLEHFGESYRIHTTITTTRTSTGRPASKKPNLQNIPARTTKGQLVRECFIASPGTELADEDFSQAEMRLGAHYSKDRNLIRIFVHGLDPHTDTAMRAFNLPIGEVESKTGKLLYRAPCKNVNFGIFYGLSEPGLYDLMLLTYATAGISVPDWLTLEWCKKFIDDWFELYPGVREYLDNQNYRAMRYGIVWDLFGRVRRVPEVRSIHRRVVSAGLRQAGNMPIQGSQAEWMKLAMTEIYDTVILPARREGIWCWPLMTIHDEMIVEVEEGYGELVEAAMGMVMERVMVDRDSGEDLCRVPVKADGRVMQRWSK